MDLLKNNYYASLKLVVGEILLSSSPGLICRNNWSQWSYKCIKKLPANRSRIFLQVVNIRVWGSPQCARQTMKKTRQDNVSVVFFLYCGKEATPPNLAPCILSMPKEWLGRGNCITWRAVWSQTCWCKPAANSLLQVLSISLSTSFCITLQNHLHNCKATTKGTKQKMDIMLLNE